MTMTNTSEPTVPLPAARLRELGRIRLGHKVPTENGKMRPAKLAHWRLTSPTGRLLEQVSELYGGGVEEWTDAPTEHRQWEILTDSDTLNVALVPGQLFSQYHEMWTKAGCRRRCDGRRNLIDDTPCACPPDPEERKALAAKAKPEACKLVTRMNVILHELEDLGVWRLETSGYYAGAELRGVAELVQGAQSLLPATLRLEQRTKNEAGKPPIHYAVPVVELLVPTRALIAQQLEAAAGGQVMQIRAQPRAELAAPQESGEGERSMAAVVSREVAADSATIPAGPGGGGVRTARNNRTRPAAESSEPGHFPSSGSDHQSGRSGERGQVAPSGVFGDPAMTPTDRTETPAAGLGPPGPAAGSTPGAPAASGGQQAPQQAPSNPAAEAATDKSKFFQDTCKALGMTNEQGVAKLRTGGWTLPKAWWKTIEGWTPEDLQEACEYLESGAQDPPAPPNTGDAA